MTTVHRIITGWAAVLALAVASPTAASARAPSTGEVVRAWNDTARSQPFENPLRLARILAIMHAAQHDAVNGAEPRYETYASTLRDPDADAEAAAAAAAHQVLVAFFPASRAALDERLAESLSAVSDGDAEGAGVALGRAVGDVVLEARADDGFGTPDPFNPVPGPGIWEPTPPAFAPMLEPQFQNVAPFTLGHRTQFLPDPPPSLTSRRYARDYNEVKLVGQDISPARTADETHVAHFWAEPSPSGWSRVGNLVSAHYRYGLHHTARLQALLNMAMADGFVAGWYQKRHFGFWRPVTAIRKGDTDANPRTAPDPSWLSVRPTPALPDYPSTHSLLGGAAAEILRRFTGTRRFPFCMVSATSAPPGTQRCWASLTHAELENAESRVLAGFHFRFAIQTGIEVGRKVGQFAMRHALRPLRVPATAAPPPRQERRPTDFIGATGTTLDPASGDEEPRRAPGEADASAWPAVHRDDWGSGGPERSRPVPWVPSPSLPYGSRSRDAG
jgi:PAP2 superfamily